MTTVYLDPSGTILARPSGRRGSDGQRLLPGAVDALQRLCDEHYDVVVLSDRPIEPLQDLGEALRFAAAPPDVAAVEATRPRGSGPAPRSWLIAADEGWSERSRPAGLRTIRVGPRLPESHRPTARFDLEARDLNAAVLEILVRDMLET